MRLHVAVHTLNAAIIRRSCKAAYYGVYALRSICTRGFGWAGNVGALDAESQLWINADWISLRSIRFRA